MVGAGAWLLFTVPALAVPDNADAPGTVQKHDVGVVPTAPSGNGANTSGPYDATGVQGPGPGLGDGNAVGRPDDGAVGNADDKNPPGQLPGPQDANVGYECEAGPNYGVGQGNPAHTTCGTAGITSDSTTPAVTPSGATLPAVTEPAGPTTQGDTVSPAAGLPTGSVPLSFGTSSELSTPAPSPVFTNPGNVSVLPVGPGLGPLATLPPDGSLSPIGPTTSPALIGTIPVSPALAVADPQASAGPGAISLASQAPAALASPGRGNGPAAAVAGEGAVSGVGAGTAAPLPDLEAPQSPASTRGALALTGGDLTWMVLVSMLFIGFGAALLYRTSSPAQTGH